MHFPALRNPPIARPQLEVVHCDELAELHPIYEPWRDERLRDTRAHLLLLQAVRMAFFHTLLAALGLSLCWAHLARAQDASAPEPDAASAVSPEAVSPPPVPEVPTPGEVARASDELELREQTLRKELAGHPLVLPGLAIGIGVPAAAILLPIGAILLADGKSYEDYLDDPVYPQEEGARVRRNARILLVSGVLATAALVYGSFKVRSLRERRRAARYELAAIRVLRTVGGSAEGLSITGDDVSAEVSRQEQGRSVTSRGRMMLTGGLFMGLDKPVNGVWHWNLGLSPGFAYFVADRIALGAYLIASRIDEDLGYGTSRTTLAMGGGVRAIYEIPVGSDAGLWVWPSLGYIWARSRYDLPGAPSDSYGEWSYDTEFRSNALVFGLALPLMFHLTNSLGIGAGPDLAYWMRSSNGGAFTRLTLGTFLVGSF